MTELLRKWAELEPERCTLGALAAWMMLGGKEQVALHHMELLPSEYAVILGAVIEAVEASGRIFALDGGLDMPDRYVANVTRKGCGWLDGTNAGAETPAAALLAAYLAALEAEAAQ